MNSQIRPATVGGVGGVVDVNAVAPGSSAIAGFGVAADPEGETVPLFPAKRDDGSTMVVISGDGHDGLAAVGC